MTPRPPVFRCAGRRDRSAMHVLTVEDGYATCSCNGVDWCSHIDATLVAGERHMVPPADRAEADRAMAMLAGRIRAPEGWTADWTRDRVWRGLAPPLRDPHARMRWDGRPTVVVQGPRARREDAAEQARSLGWRVASRRDDLTTLLIGTSCDTGATPPSITHEQWDEWCYDLTNAVLDRIDGHLTVPATNTRGGEER